MNCLPDISEKMYLEIKVVDKGYKIMLKCCSYTLKMLGKFSWVIVGWLKKKKFIILGNYYPIAPSSDLTNIGQLFLLKY